METIAARLTARLRAFTIASASATEPADAERLRRFDTVLPPATDSAPVEGADSSAAAPLAEEPTPREQETEARVGELVANVERLKAMLEAREAIDDEGARLQRALQRQEEEDSLKMITLFRKQDDAYSAELADKMASVEEATILRMRREKDEELAEVGAKHEPSPCQGWTNSPRELAWRSRAVPRTC